MSDMVPKTSMQVLEEQRLHEETTSPLSGARLVDVKMCAEGGGQYPLQPVFYTFDLKIVVDDPATARKMHARLWTIMQRGGVL